MRTLSMLGLVAIGLALVSTAATSAPVDGRWHAWLDSPGGKLPFALVLQRVDGAWTATIGNGEEAIVVPKVEVDDENVRLDFPHYDARIEAKVGPDRRTLDGVWTRRNRGTGHARLDFHATFGRASRFGLHDRTTADPVAGRWAVQFSTEEHPSVGIFEAGHDGAVHGTFLLTNGDYRYLAGEFANGELRLSTFDGAHAFLFTAKLDASGRLSGDFWSRNSWHETWTAVRDDDAKLPDTFELTTFVEGSDLGSYEFPDLDGNPRSLVDEAFLGEARLLYIFGSWCPNCADATEFLVELDKTYRDRGLEILGLAFEHANRFERDSRQVRRYAERHGVEYPLLVAGFSDKRIAGQTLPFLDRVRAYPTILFIDGDGKVRAVHTGFTGPADEEAHSEIRTKFINLIEDMLASAPGG